MDPIGCCIDQLVMETLYGGPIRRLPNEILHPILAKIELQELIRLRLVCRRWKVLIESIGHNKKTLILSCGTDTTHAEGLSRRFFNEPIVQRDFVYIKLATTNAQGDVCELECLLFDMFPNVEQLFISCSAVICFDLHFLLTAWPSEQITTLSLSAQFKNVRNRKLSLYAKCIDSFSKLNRLDLSGNFAHILKLLSPELFGRLKHFSYAGSCESLDFIPHLGAHCTRLYLSGSNYSLNSAQVAKWFCPELICAITHLSLPIRTNDELLWLFVCCKFVSLRTLQIHDYCYQNHLTPQLINVLSLLPNLAEVQLYGFYIYFDQWSKEDLELLTPLVSVQTCTLRLKGRHAITLNLGRLNQILCAIFPNIAKLNCEKESQFCIQ